MQLWITIVLDFIYAVNAYLFIPYFLNPKLTIYVENSYLSDIYFTLSM